MFSSSHLSNFLSDPTRKQSAMSKRGQEATSSECSLMARPVNCEGKSPAGFGYPVNPVNVDEGQDCHTSTRRLVRTTQNPDVERSQVRRHENAQNSDYLETRRPGGIFELYWYKETCTGSDSKNRVSKHEVHEPSIHDEDLPFLTTQRLGITARYSTFLQWKH